VKFAVSGKGGVGKTTFSALLARGLSDMGYEVVAVDADPDSNLSAALGIPADLVSQTKPLTAMDDLIEERTGVKPGERGILDLDSYNADSIEDITRKLCLKREGGILNNEHVVERIVRLGLRRCDQGDHHKREYCHHYCQERPSRPHDTFPPFTLR